MLNANIAEERRKILEGNSEVIVISKDILAAALHKMKYIFGEDVICTLLYHVGRAIGLAIRDKYLGSSNSFQTIGLKGVFQKAVDIGFVKLSSLDTKSGILKITVDYTLDDICSEKASPYPMLRGLVDGLLGNARTTIIDVRKRNGLTEIYFLINGNLSWW